MKRLIWISLAGTLFIIAIWIVGYHLGIRELCPEDATSRLEVVYVALGALFTALAFGGAVLSIIYQRQTTLHATSLEVFTKVYNTMQNEPIFKMALNYILYNYISEKETKTIDDLKREILTYGKDNDKIEMTKYKLMLYFCERMDYIGVLIKQKYVDIVLLYSAGGQYVKAFNILSDHFFTDKDRKRYIHFRYLIYRMQKEDQKYNNYIDNMESKIAKFERQKMKFSFLQKWINRSLKQSCDKCMHYKENI